jgi:hypothetical protein
MYYTMGGPPTAGINISQNNPNIQALHIMFFSFLYGIRLNLNPPTHTAEISSPLRIPQTDPVTHHNSPGTCTSVHPLFRKRLNPIATPPYCPMHKLIICSSLSSGSNSPTRATRQNSLADPR